MLVYLDHLRANPAFLRLEGEIELHEPALYRRAVADWRERIAASIRAGIARGDLRPMDDTEITALAYLMLGVSQFLDHRARHAGQRSPSDEAVVDAYLALLRGGLGRCETSSAGRAGGGVTPASRTRRAGRLPPAARPRRARR
jgi:hypothetical protein